MLDFHISVSIFVLYAFVYVCLLHCKYRCIHLKRNESNKNKWPAFKRSFLRYIRIKSEMPIHKSS
uniref:Uncharacterized protein n=1 Tax=Rhizophora mucronata TaxID=61149 RepID=A0A2P2PNC8_RHIMU